MPPPSRSEGTGALVASLAARIARAVAVLTLAVAPLGAIASSPLDDLDAALFRDLIPASSGRCTARARAAAAEQTFNRTATFTYPGSTNADSGWVHAAP